MSGVETEIPFVIFAKFKSSNILVMKTI